ncbi:hypothetical protein [Paenibacillus ihbetae]|uniref:Tail fiber protein n=1 Tax=Paenibacillus ihbetae TaxID=1870820 RepID=A0ABX3K1K7_9BACL|nr:hypothetical protein [Paenibacillus ihbetae]OOC63296.1 hypothetical protein BBD40_16365 [Paenibacillus ihbetae]
MTNPVTPNIGLNKIDRTSPATTYFDLEKYIDQNADTVDRFAGEASQAIEALQQRLDTEERREVVLQPGLQIVNAERSAPFSLRGIKGRTLVNLAGRQTFRTSSHADTMLSVSPGIGSNTDSINVTVPNTSEGYIVYKPAGNKSFEVSAGKYYVISADVKINSISGTGEIKVGGASSVGAYSADKTKIGVWQRIYHRFTKSVDQTFDIIVGVCYSGGVFAAVNFDVKNVSFYEVSQSDYDGLRALSPEQIVMEYPYVDSIHPVRNPYAIRYGENLLPPFYEWKGLKNVSVNGPYDIEMTAPMSGEVVVSVMPNTQYTLSGKLTSSDVDFRISFVERDLYGIDVDIAQYGLNVDNPQKYVTFTTGPKTSYIYLYLNGGLDGWTANFYDIMLNIGAIPIEFKPRKDSMLALQTDLFADPVTGVKADEVFKKDEQYFKLAKWKRVTIDDSLPWAFDYSFTGFKTVRIGSGYPIGKRRDALPYVIKYDGNMLSIGSASTNADIVSSSFWTTPDTSLNAFIVSVSNADSGWGDNYTPTVDEIKAYFMGWKMYDGSSNTNTPYNGNGVKAWVNLVQSLRGDMSNWTTSLPTIPAAEWTPYQLVYQLATPTVEPIVSEGMLTFNEGDNQIEVGTGIVLGELAKPMFYSANGNYYINNTAVSGSLLNNKVSFMLRVYRNGQVDNSAKIENDANAYGKQHVRFLQSDFDPSAAYSVTYQMFGTFPNVPFIGSYAANEKSMLLELTDTVQQNTSAVTKLINKKADKDTNIVQITPTLLNGWEQYPSYHLVGYYKDSLGIVHLTGLVRKGAANTVIFTLPKGYRPVTTLIFAVFGQGKAVRVDVQAGGHVHLNYTPWYPDSDWVSLDGISFLAEQ